MAKINRNLLSDLFVSHSDEMLAYVRGRFPAEESADIIQEAFLRLLQYPNPETIREPKSFLFQTAANVAVDFYRRSKTRARFADYEADIEALEDIHAPPLRQCEIDERLRLFTGWLEQLPELERHAFILFRLEGYSHKAIADKLNISVRCSERYVQKTLRYLVSCLDNIDNLND